MEKIRKGVSVWMNVACDRYHPTIVGKVVGIKNKK